MPRHRWKEKDRKIERPGGHPGMKLVSSSSFYAITIASSRNSGENRENEGP
jgi:hypothetical protein